MSCGPHLLAALTLALSLPLMGKEGPKLNSERIEAKYGSYGIDVIEKEPERVSVLYSRHDGRKICRTLAVVSFNEISLPSLEPELKRIRAGASLGATLKQAGWTIQKHYRHLGSIKAGPRFLSFAGLTEPQEVALSIYDLDVTRDDSSGRVATIIEIHHPDYLTLADLRELVTTSEEPRRKGIQKFLKLATEKMQEPAQVP